MDGIRLAREIKPHLIFLDLNMPDLSGYEVLDQIKADPLMQDVPIVIVTSATMTESERRRLEEQTCAILSKSNLSREQIETLLEKAQASDANSAHLQ